MPIWGVVNQKGGVGKTTTAVNFSSGLAARGQRVLLLDCDAQGNATSGLGIEKSRLRSTIVDVVIGIAEGLEIGPLMADAVHSVHEGLDIIPATTELAGLDGVLANVVGKEVLLREAIDHVKASYDWIILDSPPSLGIMTLNVLAASDCVLVPLPCEFYALEGLSQLMKTVQAVQRRINPTLKIGKVVLTMVDPRRRAAKELALEIEAFFGDKVSKVTIPRNVRLSEAPSFGEAAVLKFPHSTGAAAYMRLVEEALA